LFYLLHGIGLLYSINLNYGFADMGTKLALILLPVIFAFYAPPQNERRQIKIFFIAGCFICCFYNIIMAFISYNQFHQSSTFFYTYFSRLMHPAYFSIYLNLAILFIIDLFFGFSKKQSTNVLLILTIAFFLLNIMLLSSRLAIVVAYTTSFLYYIIKIRNRNQKLRIWPLLICLLVIILTFDFMVSQRLNRFDQVENIFSDSSHVYTFNKKEYNSTTVRIPLWISAWQIIEKNKYFGVGTGDIKEALDKVYIANKFTYAEEKHLSPHNQILHTGIILGTLGMLLLMTMLLYPLYFSIRFQSYLLMFFLLIIFVNMMTESLLERQAGVIFFSFFFSFCCTEYYDEIHKLSKT
jgi:hypothetical protein